MEEKKVVNVGVSGYITLDFDEVKARRMMSEAFDIIHDAYPDSEIAIVSELIDIGIPGIAYEEAIKRYWKTIGIACRKAEEFEIFPCEKVTIVGENWEDKSLTFLEECDVFIRIGGRSRPLREMARARKMGKFVYEYELPIPPIGHLVA